MFGDKKSKVPKENDKTFGKEICPQGKESQEKTKVRCLKVHPQGEGEKTCPSAAQTLCSQLLLAASYSCILQPLHFFSSLVANSFKGKLKSVLSVLLAPADRIRAVSTCPAATGKLKWKTAPLTSAR